MYIFVADAGRAGPCRVSSRARGGATPCCGDLRRAMPLPLLSWSCPHCSPRQLNYWLKQRVATALRPLKCMEEPARAHLTLMHGRRSFLSFPILVLQLHVQSKASFCIPRLGINTGKYDVKGLTGLLLQRNCSFRMVQDPESVSLPCACACPCLRACAILPLVVTCSTD